MTGQQLRNSILQEALQGRLVPNVLEPGEKTGTELLQSILAERQKKENVENGKKAKKLTLSAIEEEPWELPEGWCWTRLGDLGEFTRGNGIKKDEVVPDGYPCVRYGELYTRYRVQFSTIASHVNESVYHRSQKIERGDVVMALTGENEYDIALASVYLGTEPVAMGGDMAKLHPYVDSKYLVYAINSPYGIECKSLLATGQIIVHISNDKLASIPIPLPPISIQKAIVDKIEELFPLIDEYDKAAGELEKLNKTLPEKLRKSVLQEAFRGALVPNDFPEGEHTASDLLQLILNERQEKENIEKGKKAMKLLLSEVDDDVEELPDGWCWCKLSDIGDCLYGVSESSKNAGSYKLLRITDIQYDAVNWDTVPFSDYKKKDIAKYFLNNGDLVFARTGGTVGKSYLIQNAPRNAIYASYLIRVRFQGKALLPKYIKYFFQSPQYWSQIIENSEGTGQPNCNGTKLANLNIPLPPLTIQQRIVEKIEEVFSAIDKLTASKDSE